MGQRYNPDTGEFEYHDGEDYLQEDDREVRRAERERAGQAVLDRYGYGGSGADRGNWESYLSGRASLDEFTKDTARRAAPTADRLFDSQSDYYDQRTNELSEKGRAATAAYEANRQRPPSPVQSVAPAPSPVQSVAPTAPAPTAPVAPPPMEAYASYLGTPSAAATQNTELTGLLKSLVEQAAADRKRQEEERAAMREILMGRLKTAQEPVSTDTPGLKELIAARHLQSQRGAERERQVVAERMAALGLRDSGAFNTKVLGLEQDRSERDSAAVAEILGRELESKRAEVMQLLNLAASMGDTEAARTLQTRLAAIDAQLRQIQIAEGARQFNVGTAEGARQFNVGTAEGARRFNEDLGFRRSSLADELALRRSTFLDDLGYRLLALQLGANQQAGLAFL